MLHAGEVGVAVRRDAGLPAHVVVFAEQVGVVDGRIGDEVPGAQAGMEIAAEGVGVLGAEVSPDAARGEALGGGAAVGGVALSAVDGAIGNSSSVKWRAASMQGSSVDAASAALSGQFRGSFWFCGLGEDKEFKDPFPTRVSIGHGT